ncbi:MAG: SAM hydrolase/SAM-dependent halogenase family protein [Candidatus Rokuibacteriota bacterium]
MPPLITLTTDFGLRDPFVGIMKGVLLSICPSARLVDLTHEIEPQDVLGGALALEAALPFFPAGTVHLAVVDPGVGSARRAIAIRAGGCYLVGPDNGLVTPALEGAGWTAVSLTAPEYRRPPEHRRLEVSRTFHGRDVFAPAAAYLAAGIPIERLGPAVADPKRLDLPGCHLEGPELVGQVLDADRFGNLITSIPAARLREIPGHGPLALEVAGRAVSGPVDAYADGDEGTPTAIVGSTGRVEIFVKAGNARSQLGAGRGAVVRMMRSR